MEEVMQVWRRSCGCGGGHVAVWRKQVMRVAGVSGRVGGHVGGGCHLCYMNVSKGRRIGDDSLRHKRLGSLKLLSGHKAC